MRRTLCSWTILLTALTLSACGGGGYGSDDPGTPGGPGPAGPDGPADPTAPGAFTVTLAYDPVALRFNSTWTASARADRYRVKLKRTGATDFQVLNDTLSSFTQGFNFSPGLAIEWEQALLRVEACNASSCTAAPDVQLLPRRAEALAQKQYLKTALARSGDFTGISVATSADGNTLVVGSPLEDANAGALDTGAAQVYIRAGLTWSLQAKLPAFNMQPVDNFGFAVAISADGNTAAVGAPFEGGDRNSTTQAPNNNAPRAGAVYIFTRANNGAWTQRAYLKASNAEGAPLGNQVDGDQFGLELELSADGSTLLVGAPGEDGDAQSTVIAANANADATNNFAPDAGAAYVFTRTNDTWTQRAYLKSPNARTLDQFSRSLAISSDGSTLASGAYLENADGLTDSGAAYVFIRRGDTWEPQSTLKSPRPAQLSRFGWSLSLSATGDTLVIGAPFGDVQDAAGTGAVHLFDRVGTQWVLETSLQASDRFTADEFGWSVAFDANAQVLAIGATGRHVQSGGAYLFVRDAANWKEQAQFEASNPDINDRFASAIALSANGGSLFAGSPLESGDAQSTRGAPNNNAPQAGAVYEF